MAEYVPMPEEQWYTDLEFPDLVQIVVDLRAKVAAMASALDRIAGQPVQVEHGGRLTGFIGVRHRCRNCGYAWPADAAERHGKECAGEIARAARAAVGEGVTGGEKI